MRESKPNQSLENYIFNCQIFLSKIFGKSKKKEVLQNFEVDRCDKYVRGSVESGKSIRLFTEAMKVRASEEVPRYR